MHQILFHVAINLTFYVLELISKLLLTAVMKSLMFVGGVLHPCLLLCFSDCLTNSGQLCTVMCYLSFCVCVYIHLSPTWLSMCPALDSVVVLEEGSGVTAAHTPSDWLESEEFEPMTSDPIFMSADVLKFTKTPPPGTLSRVGSWRTCK